MIWYNAQLRLLLRNIQPFVNQLFEEAEARTMGEPMRVVCLNSVVNSMRAAV
jgi:hypothetical protein